MDCYSWICDIICLLGGTRWWRRSFVSLQNELEGLLKSPGKMGTKLFPQFCNVLRYFDLRKCSKSCPFLIAETTTHICIQQAETCSRSDVTILADDLPHLIEISIWNPDFVPFLRCGFTQSFGDCTTLPLGCNGYRTQVLECCQSTKILKPLEFLRTNNTALVLVQ